jgi:hypothetical protein
MRDDLTELHRVLVFMMPLYFRINIARNAPDFNSFFVYQADFMDERYEEIKCKLDTKNQYSEANRALLEYYLEKYNKL